MRHGKTTIRRYFVSNISFKKTCVTLNTIFESIDALQSFQVEFGISYEATKMLDSEHSFFRTTQFTLFKIVSCKCELYSYV